MKKYNSFIQAVTINTDPVFHAVLYIVDYSSGKTGYYFNGEISQALTNRINNFIDSGILVSWTDTERRYKYGMQNIA